MRLFVQLAERDCHAIVSTLIVISMSQRREAHVYKPNIIYYHHTAGFV